MKKAFIASGELRAISLRETTRTICWLRKILICQEIVRRGIPQNCNQTLINYLKCSHWNKHMSEKEFSLRLWILFSNSKDQRLNLSTELERICYSEGLLNSSFFSWLWKLVYWISKVFQNQLLSNVGQNSKTNFESNFCLSFEILKWMLKLIKGNK